MTLLEVCVDDLEGLLTAQRSGADRVELCAALSEGGLSPSAGLVTQALRLAQIPVHVLVRPRGGNFVYTPAEQEVMLADVRFLREAGAQGVVIGALTGAGDLDLELTRRLREAAGPLSATFHRAFDVVADQLAAVDALADLGLDRILTSGGAPTGLAGRDRLRALLEHAGTRLTILGCGSLRPPSVREVLDIAPLQEVHFAARFPDGSGGTDGHLVRAMRQQL